MLYRPSSFRKSAFALTTVAALAGASVLSTFPANAQQAVNYSGTAACASYAAGTEGALKCAIEQLQARTKAANERGAVADKKNEVVLSLQACMDFLKKGVADKKFSHDEVLVSAGGKLNKDNVCDAARKYGYDRRASAEQPRIN